MTENTEHADQPAVIESPPTGDQPDSKQGSSDAGSDQSDQPDAVDHGGREAAKYRRRLRDTEAERDRLAGQLREVRWSILEKEISNRIRVKPSLLRQLLADPDSMFAESGEVDSESVRTFTLRLRNEYGVGSGWGRQEGRSPQHHSAGDALDRAATTIMGRGQ